MGLLNTILSIVGFGLGLPFGFLLGYFLFLHRDLADPQIPKLTHLSQLDTLTIRSLLPDFPLWVKSPDYERVDWLNIFLSTMWPHLDKEICDVTRRILRSIFDQYIGQFYIESIELDELTPGSVPPTFSGVKFFETNEKEIMIETLVRWTSNCSIVVLVRCLSVDVTLQLKDLHIDVAPRIILKPLMSEFPCFGNIYISLLEKPHIDFGLKLFGGDIMAIPGLYHYIQETLKEQVSNLCHWPEILQLPILDCSSDMKKPCGILHAKVVRAINLQKMDFFGKSDPYVKLVLTGNRHWPQRSTVKMKNLNPVWNEQFKFIVTDPHTQVLELHVFDWDKMKLPDKIGMQEIQLRTLCPNGTKELTLDLLKNMNPDDPQNRRNRGKIVIEVKFNPIRDSLSSGSFTSVVEDIPTCTKTNTGSVSLSNGVLSLVIESAEDVEGKHHNPYALVLFRGEQRKTKRIKNSRNPRWNQRFDFMLEEPPVDERIHVEVISTRTLSFSKESLGYVDINLTDVVRNGRINEKYHLIDSRNGMLHVVVSWNSV